MTEGQVWVGQEGERKGGGEGTEGLERGSGEGAGRIARGRSRRGRKGEEKGDMQGNGTYSIVT